MSAFYLLLRPIQVTDLSTIHYTQRACATQDAVLPSGQLAARGSAGWPISVARAFAFFKRNRNSSAYLRYVAASGERMEDEQDGPSRLWPLPPATATTQFGRSVMFHKTTLLGLMVLGFLAPFAYTPKALAQQVISVRDPQGRRYIADLSGHPQLLQEGQSIKAELTRLQSRAIALDRANQALQRGLQTVA